MAKRTGTTGSDRIARAGAGVASLSATVTGWGIGIANEVLLSSLGPVDIHLSEGDCESFFVLTRRGEEE